MRRTEEIARIAAELEGLLDQLRVAVNALTTIVASDASATESEGAV